VVKNSPWRVAPSKKGGSWLPLALFGGKSSLGRFESDADNENGVDLEGVLPKGRVRG